MYCRELFVRNLLYPNSAGGHSDTWLDCILGLTLDKFKIKKRQILQKHALLVNQYLPITKETYILSSESGENCLSYLGSSNSVGFPASLYHD